MADDKGKDWRTASTRRPAAFGAARSEPDPLEPPTMSRSRVQIAGSYAPGVLMTWEGGKGICRSAPLANEAKDLKPTTIALIFENLRDSVTNWRDRAIKALPDALPELVLDTPFRDSKTGEARVERTHFQMTSPDKVGYVPYPLLYRCGICGSTREFGSVGDQARQPLPRKCNGHEARWTQIDVVYVHWSGDIEPLSPFNYNFDPQTGGTRQIRMCTCGSASFRLRNDAPVFSEWRYVCEGCGETRPLKKANPEVLSRLQIQQNDGGRTFQWIEVNMLPVSYRANSTFYVQRTSFIVFEDSAVVELMTPTRRDALVTRLAQIHDIPFSEPSDDEIRDRVEADPARAGEWREYETYLDMARKAEEGGRAAAARRHRDNAHDQREAWFADGVVERGRLGSPAVLQAIAIREDWTRRYDPIRLTIQHDAFLREHIEKAMKVNVAVDVMNPDITLTDVVNDPARKAKYQDTVGPLLRHIGVERLVLVRGLPICEFSFGYTRVSATPIYKREHNGNSVEMPVRLKAFDPLPIADNKRPIYVTQQLNEALYFKLDEDRVLRWLAANQIVDVPGDHVGRAYLERYDDFGPFLEVFKDREGMGGYPCTLPAYVYLLLHTLSHQMMHSLADTSGVDRDGIGEHIFPADLSFVIYRRRGIPEARAGPAHAAVRIGQPLRCPRRRLPGLRDGVGGQLHRIEPAPVASRAEGRKRTRVGTEICPEPDRLLRFLARLMSGEILFSPKATARLVVTMPPEPSRRADALAADVASEYVSLTRTTDAFRHLASLARERFSIMIPFIDSVGAEWAAQLFEATKAAERRSCCATRPNF